MRLGARVPSLPASSPEEKAYACLDKEENLCEVSSDDDVNVPVLTADASSSIQVEKYASLKIQGAC